MTLNVSTSPEAFLRSDFASETEAKEIASVAGAKECFLHNGTGRGEAPKDVNLTERATSNPSPFKSVSGLRSFNSAVPMWLQRKRKRKRLQMRRYRAKKAKRYVATHPTLPGEELRTVLQAIATEANA